MSLRSRLLKAITNMVFGRQSSWYGSRLPRTKYDYTRDVGDGMSSSVVAAPVLWIARTLPEAPLAVERDGEIIDQHPMTALWRRPNAFYSGHTLLMAVAISLVTNGNAYVLKVRNKARGPVELWFVPWWLMKPVAPDDGTAFVSYYEYTPIGLPQRVELEDVIHFRYGIDPRNMRLGLSLLYPLLREVFTDDEAAAFTASLLRNAGVPGLVVSPGDGNAAVTETDKKDTKEYFKQAFSGDARGEPLVMTGPTRVEQFGFNPQEMDLARLREIPEERVCAVLGIPAAVVGFGSGLAQTKVGATMAEMREMAYESCIIPLQRLVASELDLKLLPDFEASPDSSCTVFDLSDVRVLQEDQNRLAVRLDTMVRGGWMKVSEARMAMRLEVEPEHEIYLRPFSTLVVPAGQSPDEQAGTAEPVTPQDQPTDQATQKFLLAPVKATAAERQRFALRQMRDQRRLAAEFSGELADAFKRLGERAADAWLEVARSSGVETLGAQGPQTKRVTEDEIRRLVSLVVTDLDTKVLDYGPHYVRVALATVDGLRSVFGLGVNLSEPMEAKILAEGGRRQGLVDLAGQTRESLFNALSEARDAGAGPREIAQSIKDWIPAGPWSSPEIRAEVIARTETAHAQNYASLQAYQDSDTVTAIELVDGVYGEPRSDPECIARDGQVVSFDEANRLMAEEHPNGTLSFSPVIDAPKAAAAPVVNVHVGSDGKVVGLTAEGRRRTRKHLVVERDELGNITGAEIDEEWSDGAEPEGQ